jgi:hypothetical protein
MTLEFGSQSLPPVIVLLVAAAFASSAMVMRFLLVGI